VRSEGADVGHRLEVSASTSGGGWGRARHHTNKRGKEKGVKPKPESERTTRWGSNVLDPITGPNPNVSGSGFWAGAEGNGMCPSGHAVGVAVQRKG